jgi:uncharacterized SAM-binding protein YcdF (DUF218 family)
MFFPVAKILWFLAQPSSLIFAALALGAILSATSWCRLGRRLLAASLLALVVCGLTPLGDLLILPLENRFPRPDLGRDTRPVTGLIVLGGAEDSRSWPVREIAGLNEAAERFTEAVALARRFPQARIVVSGGMASLIVDEPKEAETAARLLAALGIARERITLEDRSRDTHENALFTSRLVRPGPGERWLLITSGWHMPRAIGCFRAVGWPVEAWPVDYRTSGRFELGRFHTAIPEGLRRIDLVMKEYVGLAIYYMIGRTGALFPAPAGQP